jgi:SOS-response transcriptional repressor LexA
MEYLSMPVDGSEKSYGVRLITDAMTNNSSGKKTFLIGDIIIVDPLRECKSTNYVLAFVNGNPEAVFRQYIVDGRDKFLRALNSDYQKITMDDSVKIVGVIIGHLAAL